ncbi:MAG: CHAT domain-containing protein [Planctomycetales bacterium]|nr:CHAT domain-containing protein [Planctomycetales bacterium]
MLLAEALSVKANLLRSQRRLDEGKTAILKALDLLGKPVSSREAARKKQILSACYVERALHAADAERDETDPTERSKQASVAREFYQRALANGSELGELLPTTEFNYARFLHVPPGEPASRQPDLPLAERFYQQALASYERMGKRALAEAADTRRALALLEFDRQAYSKAQRLLKQAEENYSQLKSVNPELPFRVHYLRAKAFWEQAQRDLALVEIERAIQMVLTQRGAGGGASFDRAKYFTLLTSPIEKSVEWRWELARSATPAQAKEHVAAALLNIERGRGISLEEDREFFRTDWEEMAPEPVLEAERRARREVSDAVRAWLCALGSGASVVEQKQEIVRQGQLAHLAAVRELWNLADLKTPPGEPRESPLTTVQDWAVRNKGLALYYYVGAHAVYVAVVGRDHASLHRVEYTPSDLSDRISEVRGMLVQHSDDHAEQVTKLVSSRLGDMKGKMHQLWLKLVPEEARKRLLDPQAPPEKLAVIPDGAIGSLPFDALVLDPERAEEPVYLLDIKPSVSYAFSAEDLSSNQKGGDPAIVPLLVADAVHARDSERCKGMELLNLPSAAAEVKTLKRDLDENNIELRTLTRSSASEKAIRDHLANCNWVMFAGHGFATADPGYLSCFLLVSPGAERGADSDGLLDVSELSTMDFGGVDLVVLAACQTNSGAGIRGEGVWSAARGFRLGGAKRVLATSWAVNDLAARELTRGLLQQLLEQQARGEQFDYAAALHEAKKALREPGAYVGYEYLTDPCFWAGYSLIGSP